MLEIHYYYCYPLYCCISFMVRIQLTNFLTHLKRFQANVNLSLYSMLSSQASSLAWLMTFIRMR